MPRPLTSLITGLAASPRRLFLIDGLGACLTAILLFVLGTANFFGVPAEIITGLAAIAGVYACFSLSRYFYFGDKWQKELHLILLFNLGYCMATAGLLGYYFHSVTTVGWIYFIAEIAVVLSLVLLEWKVLDQSKKKSV